MNIIEIDSILSEIRKTISKDHKNLNQVNILLVQAQNLIQKHIETNYHKSVWKHVNTGIVTAKTIEPEETTETDE